MRFKAAPILGALTAPAILLMSCLAASAFAGVLSELRDLPLYQFNEDDRAILEATVRQALESQPDGGALEWSNPETGSSGSVTPMTTVEDRGKKCRRAKIVNRVEESVSEMIFNFCLQEDGSWKAEG